MTVPYSIILRLEEKSHLHLINPRDHDITRLSNDIERTTNCSISVNTLKRILGVLSCPKHHKFRPSTLNVLAFYLGSPDWISLLHATCEDVSDFDPGEEELRAADIAQGATIEVTYLPDRFIRFEALSNSRFRIVQSVNSKLQENDVCTISSFVLHYPLIVDSVLRDGVPLGSYIAARVEGLSSVTLIHTDTH